MWKTPDIGGAANIPRFLDCALWGALPWHYKKPAAYDGQFHFEGRGGNEDEMRRFCIYRHNRTRNAAFVDFSTKKSGLKQLWEPDWHRNRNPDNSPPPVWPGRMRNLKDYHQ